MLDANKAFQRADDAWQAELERCYGRQAGDRRYDDRFNGAMTGAPGQLGRLYAERTATYRTWREAMRASQ